MGCGCGKKKNKDPKAKKPKKPCCRAGICRCCPCWYCCLCTFPCLWVWGILYFVVGLLCALNLVIYVPSENQHWMLHVLFWSTAGCGILFLVVVQIAYFLIFFESTRKLGKILFGVLFALTFLLCLAIPTFIFVCSRYCKDGDKLLALNTNNNNNSRNSTNGTQNSGGLYDGALGDCKILSAIGAIITLAFLILILHIYCYYCQMFQAEKTLFEEGCCEDGEYEEEIEEGKADSKDPKESSTNNNNANDNANTQPESGKTDGPTATQSTQTQKPPTQTSGVQNPDPASGPGGPKRVYRDSRYRRIKIFYFGL